MTALDQPPINDAILAGVATISADAIICVDDDQRIIFFNDGAESIFGYRADEIMSSFVAEHLNERTVEVPSSHRRLSFESVRLRGRDICAPATEAVAISVPAVIRLRMIDFIVTLVVRVRCEDRPDRLLNPSGVARTFGENSRPV